MGSTASSVALLEANTRFSLALFKKLSAEDKTGNVFYSPLSISSALAMVLLGARGNTATQMAESLHLHKSKEDVHVGFGKLINELNKPGVPYSLSLANRLYGEQSYEFIKEFLEDTKKHYNAELESVDFKTNAEAARLNINSWVEKKTQDKIKNLLASGVVDQLTKLVLVNAIYFKGNWEKEFKKDRTCDRQFRLNKNESKPVKMMYQNTKLCLNCIPKPNIQVLEMPYKGNDLSMLIFLPNEIEDNTTGLEELERELTYENFMKWTRPDKMIRLKVEVGLPRFKMEKMFNLKDVLTSMGMVDVFDETLCDFSGMSPANDLSLSQVVHKAFVEVNEEGTEAAAATAVFTVYSRGSIAKTYTFIADHPFLFIIRHNPSKSILFTGRCGSPE